jgi:UDP-2,3-diacylglucosamine hydrolase
MIGLIFGDTDFPKEILKTIKKKKIKKYLIIDLSKSKKFKKDRKSYSVSIGQFGKIINILKENNCKKVLFAGKVNKPNFRKLKLDFKGIYYIPRIIKASKLGDAAILKEIIQILAQNKIKTEKSLALNPELSLKKGNYSKIKPNKQDQLDIKKAIIILNNLRQYNFSQGVVVRNKKVVSIEGKGGTKKMLEKSRSKKFRNHGVLVKFPKNKQDLRVDLPTIGLKTLKQSKTAGLKGIVIKSKQHIFLDQKNCIKFANKNKMFISVK